MRCSDIARTVGTHGCGLITHRASAQQLGDVGGDAPGFVAREQPGSRPSARFILEIDVSERPVGVADDEAGVGLLDGPGRREAAGFGHEAR